MTPRSFIYNTFTARENGKTATTYCNLPGTDLSILLEPAETAKLYKRSVRAARMALDLLHAGTVKSGSSKLVIDYALAKVLAHEAFGHAAGDRRDGKFHPGGEWPLAPGNGGGLPYRFDN